MPKDSPYDLVIAGATPAGICAAIAAARRGLTVALVDPLPEPGAMLSNGLCTLDSASAQGITGISREFAREVAAYHREAYAEDPAFRINSGKPRHGVVDGLGFEPKVAALVLRRMIERHPSIAYFPRHELCGALVEANRCVGFKARPIEGKFDPKFIFREETAQLKSSEREFRGTAVIDATYEGDIAAWAGVPFQVGREARTRAEPHNGIIMSDYLTGRAALDDGWLPETFLPGSTGAADPKVMCYNVRFVVKHYGTKEGAHRLPRPANYNPDQFRQNRWFDGQWELPGRKKFVNHMNGGNDTQGDLLSTYPTGSAAQRQKVIESIYDRAKQYLYFIQTEMGGEEWGIADDEFPENGGWPYCVYVREARRIVGLKTMTEADIHRWLPRPGDNVFDGIPGDRSRAPLQSDSIAFGEFDLDSRPCDNEPSKAYKSSGEGGFLLSSLRSPYQVPYGALVPRQIEGLIVPCALSASHVAFSTVRMEPVWAQLGEAAGIAAAHVVKSGITFQALDPKLVQEERLVGGAQLYFYPDLEPEHPAFVAIQRLSLRGAARGYPDWSFRADRLVTRAEWAQMLVAGFDLAPSVTANHFDDVPPTHPAFIAFETLYDHGARVGKRIMTWERYQRVYCDDFLGYRFLVRPDADQSLIEAIRMLALVTDLSEEAIFTRAAFLDRTGRWITRGTAARLLDLIASSPFQAANPPAPAL